MLSDATITIPRKEYESLVRDSERINVIKRLYKRPGYVAEADMKAVFGFEESAGEKE